MPSSSIVLAAAAAMQLLPNSYTLVCKAERSSGFNWRNGQWVPAAFKNNSYIVTKQASNRCVEMTNKFDLTGDTFSWRAVCINMREIGSPYFPASSAVCDEFYMDNKGETKVTISCYDSNLVAKFDPDGWYHLAFIHGSLEAQPKNDYKDSQYVEVGKCSRIAS